MDCGKKRDTIHAYRRVWFTWIDTLEVQEVVLGVNLVELEVQFYHQTRVGMNVAAAQRFTHTHTGGNCH